MENNNLVTNRLSLNLQNMSDYQKLSHRDKINITEY